MNLVINTTSWVVGKTLGLLSSGLLEAWAATSELGANIDAVKMELLYAKGMLDNAQGRDIRSQALKELLQKLQQLAYDADDILDELDYFRIHDELNGTYEAADVGDNGCLHGIIVNSHHAAKTLCKSLQCSFTYASHGDREKPWFHAASKCLPWHSCSPVHDDDGEDSRNPANEVPPMLMFDRVETSARMNCIVEQLQCVCAKVSIILNMELLGCNSSNIQDIAMKQRTSTSESVEPKLYGRNKVKDDIIHDITKGTYYEKDLSVLSLYGPGGIGKTTLAQYIYNNDEVHSHFQVKIWICVSFSFSVSKLIQQIEKSIPKVDGEETSKTAEELIEQRLKSKRFLLILDDMWKCDDEDEWKRLLVPFKKGQAKGNMVIVTTRFPGLAKMVKTTEHPIALERLEDKEIMHLFEACIFGDDKPWEGHSELLETGKKIIGKLKGFPLAAKTVGRLLKNNLNLDHWTRVLESKEWELRTGDHEIMPALKLSYVYLPFSLQKCFSYCALFPYDHQFDSGELIHLWMGLGLLCPTEQNQTPEELGLRYLNDLVDHGFIKKMENNGYLCYVIHDLLHDLARIVSSYECRTIDCQSGRYREIPSHVRHLSIIMGDFDEEGTVKENFRKDLINIGKRFSGENLHTLMIFGEYDKGLANILENCSEKQSPSVFLVCLHCTILWRICCTTSRNSYIFSTYDLRQITMMVFYQEVSPDFIS